MKNSIFYEPEEKLKHSAGLLHLTSMPVSLLFFLMIVLSTAISAQDAKSINNINGGMPNRISMNVTVAKQTQGATFGEKVNAGLHAAGGALAQGASLLGGALPGGSIISAALSKVNSEDKEWEVKNQGNGFSLPENLESGDYQLTIVVVSENGTNDILQTRIRLGILTGENGAMAAVSSVSGLSGGSGGGAAAASYAATGRSSKAADNFYSIFINGVEYALVKGKTRHDTVKNSINNVR
jgi:hypothetical protein